MNPNVYLILLDSLRSDTIFGKNKSCKTPNLDVLISKGTCFSNAFSTADHTGVSWLSLMRGIFPITDGINPYKFNSNIETFVKLFKSNGFKTSCFFPDISFFKILSEQFDNSIIYEYSNRDEYQEHKEKHFENLLHTITTQNSSNSYLTCIHLMDLKYPYLIPHEFNNENFGSNRQARMLSKLDNMLGKLINSIDIKNSIIIFSSDHGDYIPPTGKNLSDIPNIQKNLRKVKHKIPSLEPMGIKFFTLLQNIFKIINSIKYKKNFSELEQRGFLDRNEIFLYDDTFHVPIVFTGKNIPTLEINKLVRHVDIFPTICGLLNLEFDETKYDGKNLSEIFHGNSINEISAYIESGPANENLQGKSIGIRNSKFKYFRSRFDKNSDVHLYDLQTDKNEQYNVAQTMPKIVEIMENELSKFMNNNEKNKLKETINKNISKLKLD